MRFDRGRQWQARASRVIPGGSHCYAKGASEYPDESPRFIARGAGCRVWDLDGNEFIEFGSGNRSVTLGHAFPTVVDAVRDQLDSGVNFTRPTPIETLASERLLGVVPAAEMVKFCKNGSDATTAAVKLARAATGRDRIAYCRDHPFFSSDDWFITTTPMSSGIPAAVNEWSLPFGYNQPDELAALFAKHRDEIAAVILEPARSDEPRDDFLGRVRELCDAHGAVMILDEMITGFRWHLGGGQAAYGVQPDLACWGKGLANGFSVSALTGKRHLMQLGFPADGSPRLFLLSTTHGAEPHALAAVIATIDCYQNMPVIETLHDRGRQLRAGLQRSIQELGLGNAFRLVGRDSCLNYVAGNAVGQPCPLLRALFLQETIRRGVLASSLVVNFSHTADDIDQAVAAISGALRVYRAGLAGDPRDLLVGDVPRPIYRR